MGKAFLLLANGTLFAGENFGAQGTRVGEVVFHTGMAGYEETLTDPAYFGQIITHTYPLIGNYGINGQDAQSPRVWAFGCIAREACDAPSNFRCQKTIDAFLKEQNVIGLAGIDTRQLTRVLRESGAMNGALTTEYDSAEDLLADAALRARISAYTVSGAVNAVTRTAPQVYGESGAPHVALLDLGCTQALLQSLLTRGCKVTALPAHTAPAQIAALHADGIALSGGPGDPAENTDIVATLPQITALGLPVLGIGLGHQLLALAAGARTEKMAHGHHGTNQPVTSVQEHRTDITTQGHGYAVVADSVNATVAEVSHVNTNDNTVEGLRYRARPCISLQYLPAARPGMRGTGTPLDEFVALAAQQKTKGGAQNA